MQYCEYRRQHLPIGSGVTEAACKTVFTQRLKLSGMRWKHEGGRTVLTLRVILLSGIWEDVYAAATRSLCTADPNSPVLTYPTTCNCRLNTHPTGDGTPLHGLITTKPTWRNTRRYSTTSAYSLTNPPARPGCSLFSHPTFSLEVTN